MPVEINVVARGNPGDPTAPKKFYPVANSAGEVTYRDFGIEISEGSSTVSNTDSVAVMMEVNKLMIRYLSHGRIIRLGNLGHSR